jgi:hypothetical protein
VDKLIVGGAAASIVWSNQDGMILSYGNQAINNVITEHNTAIQDDEHWTGNVPATAQANWPVLEDKLENAKIYKLRELITSCVRTELGGWGRVPWSKANARPIWWPQHIPWKNPRSGITSKQLQESITACFQHHNMTLYPEDANSDQDSESEQVMDEECEPQQDFMRKLELLLEERLDVIEILPASPVPRSELVTYSDSDSADDDSTNNIVKCTCIGNCHCLKISKHKKRKTPIKKKCTCIDNCRCLKKKKTFVKKKKTGVTPPSPMPRDDLVTYSDSDSGENNEEKNNNKTENHEEY